MSALYKCNVSHFTFHRVFFSIPGSGGRGSQSLSHVSMKITLVDSRLALIGPSCPVYSEAAGGRQVQGYVELDGLYVKRSLPWVSREYMKGLVGFHSLEGSISSRGANCTSINLQPSR
jgi:hypothetical protein